MPTLKEIEIKLGFDPLNPPERESGSSWLIDDNSPSPYSTLSDEESHYLFGVLKKMYSGKNPNT